MDKRTKKILLGVGGIALTSGVVYAIVRIANSSENQSKRNSEILTEEIDEEINNNPNNTQKSISVSEARSICDALFTAMDGMGTDTIAIKRVLYERKTPLKPGDFALIFQNWGWNNPDGRGYSDHRVEYGTVGLPWWGSGQRLTLCEWLREELSSLNSYGELQLLNKLEASFTEAGVWNI